jgi:hypothetical protein
MMPKNYERITEVDAETGESVNRYTRWDCERCGKEVRRYRGQSDVQCECGTWYNASGQRLRDDWRGNPSNWEDDISDLDGFEIQHSGDE